MRKYITTVLTAAVLATGCGKKNQSSQPVSADEIKVPVKTALIQKQEIQETLPATGEVQPIYRLDIFPKVAGIITKEWVRIGDVVKKDQALAELIQDIPGMEFSPVQIKATNAGTIVQDRVEIGAKVTPQQPVYTISRLNPIYVVVDIPESYLSKIDRKIPVKVFIDAFPEEMFTGRIKEISPYVNPVNRTIPVKLQLPNADRRLKPGMFARARFMTGGHQGLVAPLDAIVRSGINTYVYAIHNGRAKKISVTLGSVLGTKIDLKGDIAAGDTIVVMGQNLLEDGSAVTIVEEQ